MTRLRYATSKRDGGTYAVSFTLRGETVVEYTVGRATGGWAVLPPAGIPASAQLLQLKRRRFGTKREAVDAVVKFVDPV